MEICAWVVNELVIPVLGKMGFALTSPVCCLLSRGKCSSPVLAFLWDWPASDTWLLWSPCVLVRTFPFSPCSLCGL